MLVVEFDNLYIIYITDFFFIILFSIRVTSCSQYFSTQIYLSFLFCDSIIFVSLDSAISINSILYKKKKNVSTHIKRWTRNKVMEEVARFMQS